jgi:hypothetical protein
MDTAVNHVVYYSRDICDQLNEYSFLVKVRVFFLRNCRYICVSSVLHLCNIAVSSNLN